MATCGSKAGAASMGLSLKRAGDSVIATLGAPGASGQAPVKAPKASFDSPGDKRKGSTRYEDYPDESTSSAVYGGGCGTGQDGGMQDPGGKWIAGAIKHPGALHEQLGVPAGKKIPAKKMAAAASGSKGPLAAKRANLAKTLKKF